MNNENNKKEKRSIWRRPLTYIMLVVILILGALAGGSVWLLSAQSNTQRLNMAGYAVLAPAQWEIRLDGETAVFYSPESGGAPIGKARLINQEVSPADFGKWFYLETAAVSETTSNQFAALLTEQTYQEGDAEYTVYVFSSLPNPQPYHFAMYFDREYVSGWTARRILKSFTVPDPGANPPPKNIPALSEEEAAQSSVYLVRQTEQTLVHNTVRLDAFIEGMNSGSQNSVNILSYRKEGELLALDSWFYLDCDGERTLLYTYYQTEDGNYSYNNNPEPLSAIEKAQNSEQDLTTYLAVPADSAAQEITLFEFPKNPYQEQQNDLLQHKGALIGDNSSVGAILDSLPTPGLARTQFALQTDHEPYAILVSYEVTDSDKAYPNGSLNRQQLEKNAAVIFSLVENADEISMEIKNEEKTETLDFSRRKTEEYFEGDVRDYPQEPQKFSQYLEDVQNMPPSTPKPPASENTHSSSGGVLGEVVYSTSVTIPHGMMVTHPRTGEQVVIDPYAERYGYSQYLGKPISCVIYRTGSGYHLVASCGGAVLAEYDMAGDRDKDYVIGMIQSYGG